MNKQHKKLTLRAQDSVGFEIRSEANENDDIQLEEYERLLVGRPIVYDSITEIGGMYKEVIAKGALDETNLNDVRFMINHDMSKVPLARSRNNSGKGKSTMVLEVDDKGLLIKVKLDTRNTDAANLLNAIEREDVTGMSFQFSVEDEEWLDLDTDLPTRSINKIASVIEVSCVTFPAYEETYIVSRNKDGSLESDKEALEKAKQANTQTEEEERQKEQEALALAKEKLKILFK